MRITILYQYEKQVTIIPWSDSLDDVEVDESLVIEAALVDAMVEVVDASEAAVVVMIWSEVLGDVGVCNSLVIEVTLVDAMVEVVDAPKSVICETSLVWDVVNNVVSR